MKKIVASIGLAAVGTSIVEAASSESGVGTSPLYPVTISATVRGFYDDNVTTSKPKFDSFGFELSPSIGIANWKPSELTTLSVGYLYSAKYYFNKPPDNATHWDQTHTFNLDLTHLFTERYKLEVKESFVIGQEPDILRTGYTFETFQRLGNIPGNNIRNFGNIDFSAQLTSLFGVVVGYANTYFDYADKGAFVGADGVSVASTLAGTLNRLENSFHIDGRFNWRPQTTLIVGYRFTDVDYIGDEVIGGLVDPASGLVTGDPVNDSDILSGTLVKSDTRNNRLHYGYVGVDQVFRPDLSASVRAGASYSEFYHDPNHTTDISPYAMLSLRYNYRPDSSLEVGFSYDRTSTDLVGFTALNGQIDFTTDAEGATIYATVNHRITARFGASLMAQFQDSTYNGGQFNNENDKLYLLGLNFDYQFTPHLSANFGYTYDKLDAFLSSTGAAHPNFDRNRVYIGVTASY